MFSNKLWRNEETWESFWFLAIYSVHIGAQYPGQTEHLIKVPTKPAMQALAFDYAEVQYLSVHLKKAMELDQLWLKEADIDRFLP
jgi:hypothetical protein